MANNAIKRFLSTGFGAASGVFGAKIRAMQEEEERRRQENLENLSMLLGHSLIGQRKASTEWSQARTQRLEEPEEPKPTTEYQIELAPGFKVKAKSMEDLQEIAAGMGVDVGSMLEGAQAEDPYEDVSIRGKTPGGTVSGPYDETAGLIESMGGIVGEEKEPIDVLEKAVDRAMKDMSEEEWDDLPRSEKDERIEYYHRKLWDIHNPGIPYKFPKIEAFPTEEAPPKEGGAMNWIKRLFGGGKEDPIGKETRSKGGVPSLQEFADQLRAGRDAGRPIKWDKIAEDFPMVDIEELKRMVGE